MSASPLVVATTPAEGVVAITLSRAEKRNALSRQLLDEFFHELDKASRSATVTSIVITGDGTFFSAGADLKDIAALDAAGARSCRYLEDLCHSMARVKKPLIAAVNGPALGGGFELALMCDLIYMNKDAYFALPETAKGLIPGAGGTQRLTAAVGKFRAMRTILTGKRITSDEAVAWGLACDAVDGNVLNGAVTVASAMRSHGVQALEFAKEAICRADDLCRDDLFERNLYYATFGTDEKRRGVDDFLRARGGGK